VEIINGKRKKISIKIAVCFMVTSNSNTTKNFKKVLESKNIIKTLWGFVNQKNYFYLTRFIADL
jgi:hypothetical protein